MKITVIGGSGLIGPHLVGRLAALGHQVTLINRRGTAPPGCRAVAGDRHDQEFLARALETERPDVLIDMIAYSQSDMEGVIRAASNVTSALIVVSSVDVYLAYGRLHRTEPGPPVAVPLSEESPLRQKQSFHGETYDKSAVERAAVGAPISSVTLLRLPMVYGRPDRSRMEPYVARMREGRSVIPLRADFARWRVARAHNESCAEAIALAAVSSQASGRRLFNVAEPTAFSEQEWVEAIGHALGWKGIVRAIDDQRLPVPFGIDTAQEFTVSSEQIRSQLGFSEVLAPPVAIEKCARWIAQDLEPQSNALAAEYVIEDRVLRDWS